MSSELLPRKPLTAGSEIDSFCTRCKMDLGHRIVAMVGGAPKRVICMTCGSEHNYRAPKAAPSAPRAPRKLASDVTRPVGNRSGKDKARPRATSGLRAEWETKVRSGRPFRRYAATELYEVGDLVAHKNFGEGFVSAKVGKDKVTIVFSDGEKTLIHGLPA